MFFLWRLLLVPPVKEAHDEHIYRDAQKQQDKKEDDQPGER